MEKTTGKLRRQGKKESIIKLLILPTDYKERLPLATGKQSTSGAGRHDRVIIAKRSM